MIYILSIISKQHNSKILYSDEIESLLEGLIFENNNPENNHFQIQLNQENNAEFVGIFRKYCS